ncbi:MAG: peptidylprolyl isomerase [Tannerella sp.]|jgi:peptidyl-prolyl cis-trans isomerase SurA|nr:peptidylprolyl isomerase [Tannerella sp.]
MKKILIILIVASSGLCLYAKDKKDPVVMTVAGKDIPLSEFIFFAKKDASVDLTDKKSVANYVELFKNYKLKVADAEALGVHKAPRFDSEFESYRRQLQQSFLSDKAGEDSAIHHIYERTKLIPAFKYIVVRFPGAQIFSADTVAPYNKALAIYERIKNGEAFEAVGQSLATEEKNDSILYGEIEYLYPLQVVKELEEQVYSMQPNEVSPPLRTIIGYHIVKLDSLIPNPGTFRVAHILTPFGADSLTDEIVEAARLRSDSLRQLIIGGANFEELAKTWSGDSVSSKRGGLLSYYGLGGTIKSFEQAAYALKNAGDISEPVRTRLGFHIIKLIDRKESIPFEEMESGIAENMKQTERNFDLYKTFDEKMKARHNYILYPEAYAELEQIADKYFASDTSFYYRTFQLTKPLIRLDTLDFPQYEFAEYIYRKPSSMKSYSPDFMKEIFDMFVRDIVTEMERDVLERDYPEYNMLVKEYYDGILLFEISNKRVWSRPAEQQEALETEWLKEITAKYPVVLNTKVIKKIKKYL